MLAEERKLRIREILAAQRTVTVTSLMQALDVTTATIRRDLAILESEGVLIRSHGGAISRAASTDLQLSYEALQRSNRTEKQAIALEAEKLIQEGDTVFLEGSTTVFELACLLVNRMRLTVVTNSPPILDKLQQSPNIIVMSTGGELQKDTAYLSGAWTQQALSQIRVDKAILGISALDSEYGVSTTRPALAEIKKFLVRCARTRIALADHTKFGRQDFVHVGPLTDYDIIITDAAVPEEQVQACRKKGVQIMIAGTKAARVSENKNTKTNKKEKNS